MITTFSLEELRKPLTGCKAKSHLIELSSTLEWIDMCSVVRGAICDLLFPEQAVVDNNRYEMTWCMVRNECVVLIFPLTNHHPAAD
jgi:hypothetical protein